MRTCTNSDVKIVLTCISRQLRVVRQKSLDEASETLNGEGRVGFLRQRCNNEEKHSQSERKKSTCLFTGSFSEYYKVIEFSKTLSIDSFSEGGNMADQKEHGSCRRFAHLARWAFSDSGTTCVNAPARICQRLLLIRILTCKNGV
jgi:hypothetical protein